jgi:hypothetical protein
VLPPREKKILAAAAAGLIEDSPPILSGGALPRTPPDTPTTHPLKLLLLYLDAMCYTNTRYMALDKQSIAGVVLGEGVQKRFGTSYIFRLRAGNGYFGAALGVIYQDKYSYFVPSSITNTEGQAARDLLAAAVGNWQSVLSDEEKANFNARALNGLQMSGYNLYIREYILANS